MKLLLIAFAVIAAVAADVSHIVPSNEYLPPVQEAAPVQVPTNEYLPPVQAAPTQIQYSAPAPAPVQYSAPAPQVQYSAPVEAAPAHTFSTDDGYRYKTHRRVVYRRHRRDVSHLVPSNEYLPPVQEAAPVQVPTNEYLPPVQAAPTQVQYSAPVAAPAPTPVQYSAPAPQVQYSAPVEAAPAHTFSTDDGYRYKTHRRVVYRRHRRDVSHLVPSNEYLPPVQEAAPVQVPTNEYLPPVQAAPTQVQYSAPVAAPAPAPVQYSAPAPQVQYSAPVEAAPAHTFSTDDGYRYKTHRRVVYRRHRRDVSHLVPSNEYLPPVQEAAPVQVPTNEYLPPVQAAPSQVQYSAPVAAPAPAPVQYSAPAPQVQYSAPVEAAPAHTFSTDDGYRYKTHRRVVYRRRH